MLQVPGYTRRMETGEWNYSEKVQQVLSDYIAKYALSSDFLSTSVIYLLFALLLSLLMLRWQLGSRKDVCLSELET